VGENPATETGSHAIDTVELAGDNVCGISGRHPVEYVKPERLLLKGHVALSEKWVQDRIAEDPALLGLGPLVLRDKERAQPRAGRLDLLLQDPETHRRYEVELQLGRTDESHIIRTLEYWDLERKRYPQYDHCAVIVAEEITARFLNVISLFNGAVPLIAIQMTALKFGEAVALVFTKVLDEVRQGPVDEDEEVYEEADRSFWEARATKATVAMCDELLKVARVSNPKLELKYNKFYIGLAEGGQPNNFVIFRPTKDFVRVEPRLERSEEVDKLIEAAGLDTLTFDGRWGRYRIRVDSQSLKKDAEVIKGLIRRAYESFGK
jgi:hypothetical protein